MEVLDGDDTAITDLDMTFKSPPQPISIIRRQNKKIESSAIPIEVPVGPGNDLNPAGNVFWFT